MPLLGLMSSFFAAECAYWGRRGEGLDGYGGVDGLDCGVGVGLVGRR